MTPPRLLSSSDVPYPDGASGSAEVTLELVVDAGGTVGDVTVVAGAEPFAAAAAATARAFRFEPARRGEQPVAARIRFVIGFEQQSAVSSEPPPVSSPPAAASTTPAAPIEVRVVGDKPVGAKVVSRAFARQLPGAFGNPFAAIEASPGVTPTLSGAPYFYVRGSPPGNLGYFIDDIRLPALFHVLAGPSVVHPALVHQVDFYAGPYPARYGRFAGGIAAGTLRPPTHELHGEVSVRAYDSSALIELPIASGAGPLSLALGGRFSYANPIARLFDPDISVSFWDYQARVSQQLSAESDFGAFIFGARDALDRENDDGERQVVFGSEFHRLAFQYTHKSERGSARLLAALGSDSSAQSEGAVKLGQRVLLVRADLSRELGSGFRLAAGADGEVDRYTLDLGALEDEEEREDFQRRYPTRVDAIAGAYGSLEWRGPALRLELGARLDAYHSGGESAVAASPRVSAEFQVTPRLRLIQALGLANQMPSSVTPQPGNNPVLGRGLQHAVQSSAGVAIDAGAALSVEATLFQTAAFNLSDPIGISRIDNGDEAIEDDEDARSTGSSRGLELRIERSFAERLGAYLSYTLASSRRSVGRAEGPSLFDRTHVLSGAASYRFGGGYHAGLRGSFYTGVPADVAYLAAARDPPRSSPFYRLDVRAEKRFRLGEGGAYWSIVLEVLNTTLHEEALGKSCNAYVCREDTVGPLTIPSLGVEASF